ncbi:MAG: dihydrolipoamide acetyltransferase family protein [Bacteroidota bacterium]
MAQVELIMPKMGESIMEATILKWVKQVGDTVETDETILEIATDKVDSEVPSPVDGTIAKILFQENDTVEIGKVIALIATEGEVVEHTPAPNVAEAVTSNGHAPQVETAPAPVVTTPAPVPAAASVGSSGSARFYSPLVRNMALAENIGMTELERVPGTGKDGRVTKKDMLAYITQRQTAPVATPTPVAVATPVPAAPAQPARPARPAAPASPSPVSVGANVEIVEMDRMRKLIADHMVRSKQTSPHVTSFVEVDMTKIVNWRNRVKVDFQKRYGQKITYTPIMMEAMLKAIRDFPMVNVSVDGNHILVKKNINMGMATALPSGNLIVPVIKNADRLNLLGLTEAVNDLAGRARGNKLKPEEIQDGTITITNVGTFGNVMGTPIINQPQVAILATGAIRKKPAVLETEHGDVIAIRHLMFLSLSYDHRVVDGFLGGSFLRRIGDYLEAFDDQQTI